MISLNFIKFYGLVLLISIHFALINFLTGYTLNGHTYTRDEAIILVTQLLGALFLSPLVMWLVIFVVFFIIGFVMAICCGVVDVHVHYV
jgi:hypothetical protein